MTPSDVGIVTCGVCGAAQGSKLGHLPGCQYLGVALPPLPGPVRRRPSWDDYFFAIAKVVASRATCPRAHVGCVLVDPATNYILATGFNGSPAGAEHCEDVGCTILAEHCVTSTHSEENAVLQYYARTRPEDVDAKPLVAYCLGSRPVCSHCARMLHEIGVTRVEWRAS